MTTKPIVQIRHDPYSCCLLAPEDSVRSSMLPFSTETPAPGCSPETMSYYTNQTPYSGLSSPFVEPNINAAPFEPHQAQGGEEGTVEPVNRSLFHSHDILNPLNPLEGFNLSKLNNSPSTMPSKNIGKIYVSGRPRPVLCRHSVEVTVALRYGEGTFIISDVYEIFPSDIEINDLVGLYVIVEGDRGEDMGIISAVNSTKTITAETTDRTPEKRKNTSSRDNDNKAGDNTNLRRVLRQVSNLDIMCYEKLPEAEEEALLRCQEYLEEADLNVPITIERAIFQYDRKKLTLQYTSESYVDFKVLTRMLHTHYKCRIWMHQLNRNVQHTSNDSKTHGEHRRNDFKTNIRNKNHNNGNRRRE